MIETEVLYSDQGIIGIGRKGEKDFGRRNFMELFSVFTSPPLVKIMYGRQEVGEVDQTTFSTGGVETLRILTKETHPVKLSQRAKGQIATIREDYDWLEPESTLIVKTDSTTQWWTFAGLRFNQAAASALQDTADKVSANNLSIEFSGHEDPENIHQNTVTRIINSNRVPEMPIDSDFIDDLKFSKCVSAEIQALTLSHR